MHDKIRVADIRRKTRTKAISDFLRRVLPDTATSNCNGNLPSSPEPELGKQLIVPKFEAAAKTPLQKKIKKTQLPSPIPSASKELYDNPKQGFIRTIGANDEDATEEGAKTEEEENFGTVAVPPRSSILFLDTQYGIHKDGEQLMMGDSPVFVDTDDNLTNKGTAFRGT